MLIQQLARNQSFAGSSRSGTFLAIQRDVATLVREVRHAGAKTFFAPIHV